MLRWPDRAKRSVAVFFSKWNDFDIYVEDNAKAARSVYPALAGRILGEKCRLEKVIPLGDREKVIEAASKDTGKTDRRRLYIIDGDLDLVAGIPAPSIPKLFRHRVYHLENYFLCREALTIVLHEDNPRYTREEIEGVLDFDEFLKYIKPLVYLFSVYGLTRQLAPSLPTISVGVGAFVTDRTIDVEKIRSFCESRVTELEANFDKNDVDLAKVEIDKSVAEQEMAVDVISAREYVIPVLRWWLSKKGLHFTAGKDSLHFRLAKLCNMERHTLFRDAILKCSTAKA